MQHFVSAVLGGVVTGVLVVLLVPQGTAPSSISVEAAPSEPRADRELRLGLEKLAEQVRALESRGNSTAVTRTRVETQVPVQALAKLRALESELADLRQRISLLGFEARSFDDPDEARMAIRNTIYDTNNNGRFVAAMARIPLRVSFLEAWPRHDDAEQQLGELVDDYIETHQQQKAISALDRFGPLSGLPAWELDLMRLRAAYRDDDRIEIARRVAGGPVESANRAWAMSVLATSLARTGRRTEALAAIESLAREFAGTDAGGWYVKDAEDLRARLAEAR